MIKFDSFSQTIARHPNKTIIIATHGTVMTLFITAHNPTIAPFPFWQQLQMPDYTVLTQPSFKFLSNKFTELLQNNRL